jgi:hypothetical protein
MSFNFINITTEQFAEQSTISLLGNMARRLPEKTKQFTTWPRKG